MLRRAPVRQLDSSSVDVIHGFTQIAPMKKAVSITLGKHDPCVAVKLCRTCWGQIIDGLICRAEQYEQTADYYVGGNAEGEILQVRDADEALFLAEWYRRLAEQIRNQLRDKK